jgi:hypothetical protein
MITKARDPDVWAKAQYVDISKNWRRLKPLFESAEAEAIWRPCMEEFQEWMRWKPSAWAVTHPRDYDGCDWRCEQPRQKAYWQWACHSACHWVVDLGLFVAKKAMPEHPWRILTARHHTTAWNGSTEQPLLFDINFSALGVEASEALKIASKGRELKVGKYLKGHLHEAKGITVATRI